MRIENIELSNSNLQNKKYKAMINYEDNGKKKKKTV